jgi:hypothetical protein
VELLSYAILSLAMNHASVIKAEPEKINGNIYLPNMSAVRIDRQAVENNESTKTALEFIHSLKKASKRKIFPPLLSKNENHQ